MKKRMVIVSNRLPIVVSEEQGDWRIKPGAGGLVTALAPLMSANHGVWVGWPGCDEQAPLDRLAEEFTVAHGYALAPLPLSEAEIEQYYRGFSNETLWPLFHDLLGNCHFNLEHFESYRRVNRKFAEKVAEVSLADDFIWVHDYQLLMTGQQLRQLGLRQPLAFFLHIPFPAADLLRRLPWKDELLESLLAFDLLGFQTLRDQRNFVHGVTSFIPEVRVVSRHRTHTVLQHGERTVKAGHFPISIDYDDFAGRAASEPVADAAWYLHENYQRRQIMLGVDRLDYTKGIPERFLAFERALEKYPEMREKVTLLQIVVPSRTLVPDYLDLKSHLEQLAGRINGRFAMHGWVPLHYHYRSLDPVQLLAHYRSAEIALVTPLRDGMNLVAKEYCACSVENRGVLILSEFAGAADQLGRQALLVNPYDCESTADAIHRAFRMPATEQQRRMTWLRGQIKRHDVHRWLRSFVAAAPGGAGR
ncbi:MAG: trehalose-6-phosphate synthase [Desulfuromonadales bacterium]|nr:trehalose-6-phosphate synthase [Desulfuromonadales bacterium]